MLLADRTIRPRSRPLPGIYRYFSKNATVMLWIRSTLMDRG
jgi:hypothetical protein